MQTPNTRDHLLDVGLNLIRSMGYASTGMKEILDAADVPKGSFYHYFPSKEAYANEVLKLYVRQETERFQRIFSDRSLPPLQRLRRYFEELIAIYGPTPEGVIGCMIGNLTLERADHSDSIQAILRESFSRWQAGLAGVLREAVERGDLPSSTSSEELAGFILNSYQGALLRSKADRSSTPLEAFLDFVFNSLLKPSQKPEPVASLA